MKKPSYGVEMTPERLEMQRIVCAAYVMEDGRIVSGVRHLSPDMRSTMKAIYGDKYHLKISRAHHSGGFIDQFGNYLDRNEAWAVAKKQNQIKIVLDHLKDGPLFSEHLY